MKLRYLFGPVPRTFAEQKLHGPRQSGCCLTFHAQPGEGDLVVRPEDSWEEVLERLPAEWKPDLLVLWLPYTTVPACLWSAPLPRLALATDWHLLWHYYRRRLPACQAAVTDTMGAELFALAGLPNVRPGNLCGCERVFVESTWPKVARDIDVLLVGNFNPAVQRERMPWLTRLARLGRRWRVVLRAGVFGEGYRRLLARSRIVFHASNRHKVGPRAFEAAAAGALVFQERGNRELPAYFRDRQECIYYDPDEAETLLEYYLEHEEERQALAEAARARVGRYRFEDFWEEILASLPPGWMDGDATSSVSMPATEHLLTRCWQALQGPQFEDLTLVADLEKAVQAEPGSALLHNALGVMLGRQAQGRGTAQAAALVAAECFRRALACRPEYPLAGLNLAEALAAAGKSLAAIEAARRTLDLLQRERPPEAASPDDLPWGPSFDSFHVEWERLAWTHAGRPVEEARARDTLLRWRLCSLLAQWTGERDGAYEAVLLRPDLAVGHAGLGLALLKEGRSGDAAVHLRQAMIAYPLDRSLARACFQAVAALGDVEGQQRLTEDQRLLSQACPALVPHEPWFAAPSLPIQPVVPSYRPSPSRDGKSTRRKPRTVLWEGGLEELQSLALVNRHLCLQLLRHGHDVSIWPQDFPLEEGVPFLPAPEVLAHRIRRPLSRACDVHVRHRWPPDFTPPPAGHWVHVQPWEFGSLPRAWIRPLAEWVDEVWAYSRVVQDCYVSSGIDPARVHVVPLGVDVARFRPGVPPLPLKTQRRCKFLFVGGTTHRKGFDVLLDAYARTFSSNDDVCLVVKDMGVGTFYRGQTAEESIARLQAAPGAPEVEYLSRPLSEDEQAALYAACDCLVHPYRGEGFGLPIAEAMACGLPVIVTGLGAALDYCDESRAYLIPAEKRPFNEDRVGGQPTVGRPWLAEPDGEALAALLRHVLEHPDEARAKGAAGSAFVRDNLTWEHAGQAIERRLEALSSQPVRRLVKSSETVVAATPRSRRKSLCMIVRNEEHHLPDCLRSVKDLFDQVVVTDTGSTDRTREIAAEFGAQVIDFPWPDSFGAARNESLRHATGDWVMWLDADDRLDEENRQHLTTVLDSLGDELDAYAMKVRSVLDAAGTSFRLLDQVRLFPNRPEIRWDYRIHEQILPAVNRVGGGVRWANVVIDHVGYADAGARRGKLERNLRLLELDYADRPDDGFTLFNLGWTLLDLGRTAEALTHLEKALEKTNPSSSTLRKLYHLLALAYRHLNRIDDALRLCRDGLERFPLDAELLAEQGLLRRDQEDFHGVERSWLSLLDAPRGQYFASEELGLRGFRTRQLLAEVYRVQERWLEAEVQWRAALAERGDFEPAWMGLAELYLRAERWGELEYFLEELEQRGITSAKVGWLRARGQVQRQEWAAARRTLTTIIAQDLKAVPPRVLLSQVLLQEGRDWEAAERALRDVLTLEPNHRETRHNLETLLRRLGRKPVLA
jgi:glycosyltransferase involved in cell wall biosynthesis